MALVQNNLFKIRAVISQTIRSLSVLSENKDIKKSVFISQSKDIFTNLALEKWLYKNFDFTNHHVLMLWKNEPCVVIGKHQNPWQEINLSKLPSITENGVKLARRNSGGGTVYHDEGNLNMTFFTPRDRHNKRYNLEIINRALFRNYKINLEFTQNGQLNLRNFKISETTAKLGHPNGYHHCNLSVKVNKVDRNLALQQNNHDIVTIATKSTTCNKMKNLCEENPKINTNELSKSIGWEYLRTSPLSLKDEGMELANKQKGFQMINPTEQWFPGISQIRNELSSWQWIYGQTPKFTISRSFIIPENLVEDNYGSREVQVVMIVENGRIIDVNLYIPSRLVHSGLGRNIDVITNLKGSKFSENTLTNLELSIEDLLTDKEHFVADGVRQVMFSI